MMARCDPLWQVPLALLPAAVSLGEASGDALSGEALPPQGLVSDMTQGPDTSLSGLEWSSVGGSNPNPNPSSTPNPNPSPNPSSTSNPNPSPTLTLTLTPGLTWAVPSPSSMSRG